MHSFIYTGLTNMVAVSDEVSSKLHLHKKVHARMAEVSFFITVVTKLLFLYSAFMHMLHKQRNVELLLIQTLFACALFLRLPYWMEIGDKKLSAHLFTLLAFTLVSLILYALPFIHV